MRTRVDCPGPFAQTAIAQGSPVFLAVLHEARVILDPALKLAFIVSATFEFLSLSLSLSLLHAMSWNSVLKHTVTF